MAKTGLTDEMLVKKYVRGFPVPDYPMFVEGGFEFAMDYVPRDNDVILTAYPRTGSTWTLYLVWQILHKTQKECILKDFPIAEMVGKEVIESLPEPRFYKYHLPYNLIKLNRKAKYIYVHRKPEDMMSSYYHFMAEISGYNYDFDSYFEAFMTGGLAYGDFFDHVLATNSHLKDGNILLVFYDELKKDTRSEILRIAKFLGDEYYQSLKTDESLLQKILDLSSFEYMKKNAPFPLDVVGKQGEVVNFYRTGRSGDGKKHLSKEQAGRLRNKMMDKMKGTEFIELWTK